MVLTIVRDVSGMQCPLDMSMTEAVRVLERNHGGTVFCVDDSGILFGTLTDGDVRRHLIRGGTLSSPVREAMNTRFLSCYESDPAASALAVITRHKITALPIVGSGGKLIGYYPAQEVAGKDVDDFSWPVVPVIMAGGKGTRLLPLTIDCPKPLLKIGGKPILQIILEQIAAAGFSQAVISVGYLANMIVDYFGSGESVGLKLTYLYEDAPLGTAGALRQLDKKSGFHYLVINGDVLSTLNLKSLVAYHFNRGASLTVASRIVETSIPYGVLFDTDGEVTKIQEKPMVTHKISAGVYLIDSQALALIPPACVYDMPDLLRGCIESQKKVLTFPLHEEWIDVGLPRTLLEAQEKWK